MRERRHRDRDHEDHDGAGEIGKHHDGRRIGRVGCAQVSGGLGAVDTHIWMFRRPPSC